MRLPDPALDGTLPGRVLHQRSGGSRRYLRDASWRQVPSDVRTAAKRLLASSGVQDVMQERS
jgi:hypothetical protein